jgi:Ni/Co efflux regulator RcnB
MKTLIAVTALAVSLVGGAVTSAHADGRESRHERRHEHRDYGHGHHDARKDRHHRAHHWDHRDSYRAGYIKGRHDQRRYKRGRYAKPPGYVYRAWRRGDRLPSAYYSRHYIVRDYHVYHLSPPPRGHYWVRVDNDVVLTAVASGIVAGAVYGLFH